MADGLITKRGRVKRALTLQEQFLQKNVDFKIEEHRDYLIWVARLEKIKKLQAQFDEIQEQLIDENEETHDAEQDQFESRYFSCLADFQCKVLEYEELQVQVNTNQNPGSATNVTSQCNVKLPEIALPQFNGDYTQWLTFRDTFQALVLDNPSISNVARLFYLNSTLIGEPKALLQNLSVSEANFDVAWELLLKRYNNTRLISSDHVQKLFQPPELQPNSHRSLRALIDHFNSHVNAIKALQLEVPLDQILLSQLLLNNLNTALVSEWEDKSKLDTFPTFQQLIEFLERKCKVYELSSTNSCEHVPLPPTRSKENSTAQNVANKDRWTCAYCKADHFLLYCDKFRNQNVSDRFNFVKRANLCTNCLSPNKFNHICSSRRCRHCNQPHHTLLHFNNNSRSEQTERNVTSTVVRSEAPNLDRPIRNCVNANTQLSHCLLATAAVGVTVNNSSYPCIALLDSGSDCHLITQSAVNRLGLHTFETNVTIQGVTQSHGYANKYTCINVHSADRRWKRRITCLVVRSITSNLPRSSFDVSSWRIPPGVPLADPLFNVTKTIDILFGANVFFDIMCPGKILPQRDDLPIIQETRLGWILAGNLPSSFNFHRGQPFTTNLTLTQSNPCDELSKFWELDNIDSPTSVQTDLCEEHFVNTHYRNEEGRYVVSLPFKSDAQSLGESRQQALKRFKSLERRLSFDSKLKSDYIEFMEEYKDLGHMQLAPPIDEAVVPCYYIPHHAVFKPTSSTTKTRVVFDASAKTSNGLSLNDILAVGPVIQPDIFTLLLNFRTFMYAFTSDISKMYRQVLVEPTHRDLQRILWRSDPLQPVQEFQLNTVTYGTAPASFLSTRVLNQVVLDEGQIFPLASEAVLKGFYIDDLIFGTDSVDQTILLYRQITSLLRKAGFHLRKWSTNCSELLNTIPPHDREQQETHVFSHGTENCVRTLGLIWNPSLDNFAVQASLAHVDPLKPFTKRMFLATISSIWDPLGLICPLVTKCKILLQLIWMSKIHWDQELPSNILDQWLCILTQLPKLSQISIPRSVKMKQECTYQLIGFADASEAAYGACLYVRSQSVSGEVSSKLLCSKSKVAPIKRVSLPRLELCAALLLAKLTAKVLSILNLCIQLTILCSDSMITLAWITSPSYKWKTFIANRVSIIQELVPDCHWQHVKSSDNPADIISRGSTPAALECNDLWWHGPHWLFHDISQWKFNPIRHSSTEEISEERKVHVNISSPLDQDIFLKFSSHMKLIRVIAYCRRFIYNCRHKTRKQLGALLTSELHQSLTTCVKIVQSQAYAHEIAWLTNHQELPSKSNIVSLHPFLHTDGTLRVGGRLQNTNLPFDVKHQFLLPKDHIFSKNLISYMHLKYLHAGCQLTLAQLRQSFWIPAAKSVIRKIIHHCVTCAKFNASLQQQLMADLPASRVQPNFPFASVGVDYAGPISMKFNTLRAKTIVKAYLAIFVCMVTKAIHVEVVTSLSTQAFIAAFVRFVSRRGLPSAVYSDNGTNFLGAQRELSKLRLFLSDNHNQRHVHEFTSHLGVEWHFIPPSSPHFGGLWEAGVKSLKHHLKRTMQTQILTYEELNTLMAQIEAILNSRPLTSLSDDPNDLGYLSPGHFLIGRALTSLPTPDLAELPMNRLTRWQLLQKTLTLIWQRWSIEYLNTLQQRTKWQQSAANLKLGDLVIVKEDNLPPMLWRLGRVIDVHPGKDNLVRVATLKTMNGVLKRPIHKLMVLPIS